MEVRRMREIKFRAWDDVKDRLLYLGEEDDIVFEFGGSGIVATDITEDEPNFKTLYHLIYLQYTGLKDKSEAGQEIWEGDIRKDALGRIFKVVYDNDLAAFYGEYTNMSLLAIAGQILNFSEQSIKIQSFSNLNKNKTEIL